MRKTFQKKLYLGLFTAFAFVLISSAAAEAAWIWSPDIGKWINPKSAAKDTPEEQYDWALSFFNQKDWDKAIEEFEKLADTFPTSRLAAEGVYYAGQAWEKKDDLAKAADNYRKLVDKYPYSDRIKDAIRAEFEIANEFAQGGKVKMLGYAVLPGQEKALELYNHIVKNAPYGSYGDQAQYKIGELYQKQGEFELARKAFQAVVDEYPSSELIAKARYQVAQSSMRASNKTQYNDKDADSAIEQFQEFKNEFPVEPEAFEADESIRKIREEKAGKAFETASFYEQQKKWKSAKVYYQDVIKKYPETEAAKTAKTRLDEVIRKEAEPEKSGIMSKLPKMPKVPKIKLWGKD